MRPGRILSHLPEWHAAILVLVFGIGAIFVPPAETEGLTGVVSCGWYGWVGMPSVVCPPETLGGQVFASVMNLPIYPVNAGAALAWVVQNDLSAWPTLLRAPVLIGIAQLFLLAMLILRGLRRLLRLIVRRSSGNT